MGVNVMILEVVLCTLGYIVFAIIIYFISKKCRKKDQVITADDGKPIIAQLVAPMIN